MHIPKSRRALQQTGVRKLQGFDALMALAPEFAKPLKAAIDADERGEFVEALKHFGQAAQIDPTNKALLHFGVRPVERAYFGIKHAENPPPDEYIAKVRRFTLDLLEAATEAFPEDPVALHNVGKFLHDDGQDEAAIQWYRRALAMKRDQVESWGNLGTALYSLGHVEEAELCWSKCVAFPAENASGLYTQGYIWLRRGDYIRGWPALNARWNDETFGRQYGRRDLLGKAWTGQPLRKGDALLVHGEQGFGDHIQFARYIPVLRERGIKVAGLETRGPLVRWFQQSLEVPVFLRDKEPLPKYTHHAPLMSLPGLLKCWDAPAPIAPLQWKPLRLTESTSKRIGIVWAGTAGNIADHERSMPAAELRHLANIPGVTWVPLQYDPSGTADITARSWLGKGVETSPQYPDALGLAEIMAGLDAVVSVDTLAAHVAGSIGCPTYILHRFNREWRWGQSCETTPWYPSVTSLTCPKPGDWQGVLTELRARLSESPAPASR